MNEDRDERPAGSERRGLREVTESLKQIAEMVQHEHDIKRTEQEVRREEIASGERVALAVTITV